MIDKSFINGYPHDSFEHFLKFVARRRPIIEYKDFPSHYAPNIQIVLLYSLLTGIKISKISVLKWSDIIEINNDFVRAKVYFEFDGLSFPIHQTRFQGLISSLFNRIEYETLNSPILTYKDGTLINQKHLSRDIRYWLKMNKYPFYKEFLPISTQIMYGRRVLKVHGFDKDILNNLKRHLNRKNVNEMLDFLYINHKEEEPPREIFEDLFFDRNGIYNY